ncbi:hypothetical protein [Nonomuraea diastatica]|uniref:hypothetical protein n=1 Tax=Nonomuraea diastatica TaxID=1848329 RepID=UPI001FE8AC43|nr:hypothetical protein [Nonomuraea diastatica]
MEYRQGAAVRRHQVAPKTIRRVLDAAGARNLPDLLDAPPTDTGEQRRVPALGPDVILDPPGLLADHLRTTGDATIRQALASGRTIRRGHGYSVRITAPLAFHRAVLEQSAALADAGPTERKAHRVFAARVTAVRAT